MGSESRCEPQGSTGPQDHEQEQLARLSDAIDESTARWLVDHPRDGLVSSRLESVFPILSKLALERCPPGSLFLEWGSGFGGVAQLATLVGWRSYGIERQVDLVEEARRLTKLELVKSGPKAEFAWGNFIPPSAESFGDHTEYEWWSESLPDGYDAIGRDLDEFDVIYAYPWPGEEDLIDALFLEFAAVGSTLVTHHGCSGFRTVEKRADGTGQTLDWS